MNIQLGQSHSLSHDVTWKHTQKGKKKKKKEKIKKEEKEKEKEKGSKEENYRRKLSIDPQFAHWAEKCRS